MRFIIGRRIVKDAISACCLFSIAQLVAASLLIGCSCVIGDEPDVPVSPAAEQTDQCVDTVWRCDTCRMTAVCLGR